MRSRSSWYQDYERCPCCGIFLYPSELVCDYCGKPIDDRIHQDPWLRTQEIERYLKTKKRLWMMILIVTIGMYFFIGRVSGFVFEKYLRNISAWGAGGTISARVEAAKHFRFILERPYIWSVILIGVPGVISPIYRVGILRLLHFDFRIEPLYYLLVLGINLGIARLTVSKIHTRILSYYPDGPVAHASDPEMDRLVQIYSGAWRESQLSLANQFLEVFPKIYYLVIFCIFVAYCVPYVYMIFTKSPYSMDGSGRKAFLEKTEREKVRHSKEE